MKKEECFRLGTIVRTHGVHGELVLLMDSDYPSRYAGITSCFIGNDSLLEEFKTSPFQISGNKARFEIAGIHSPEEAERFLKREVYLPLSMLPPLDDSRFYFHEAVGFDVFDKDHYIGIFQKVIEMPGHPVAVIQNKENEMMVPLVKPFIKKIDRQLRKLFLDLPEGLADIYSGNAG